MQMLFAKGIDLHLEANKKSDKLTQWFFPKQVNLYKIEKGKEPWAPEALITEQKCEVYK